MNRYPMISALLIFLSSSACMNEAQQLSPAISYQADARSDSDQKKQPCTAAQQHINECLGLDETPLGECNQEAAEVLISMSCQELQQADQDQKTDGSSWLDQLHCRIGVLHFCPVPVCEAERIPNLSESCIQALDASDCAQCDYYPCLEEQAQCGPKGYLLDFVGKYCQRFTQVTYPRLTPIGKVWMDTVRDCLIMRMDEGYYEGESCESIEERGINDHIACYVDSGICSLPLGDWLKIVATIPPYELPLLQALSVGGECIQGVFK